MQGFGNVGAWAAEILTEMGGKVLAVSDVGSAVVNENGLDIKAIREHLKSGKAYALSPPPHTHTTFKHPPPPPTSHPASQDRRFPSP